MTSIPSVIPSPSVSARAGWVPSSISFVRQPVAREIAVLFEDVHREERPVGGLAAGGAPRVDLDGQRLLAGDVFGPLRLGERDAGWTVGVDGGPLAVQRRFDRPVVGLRETNRVGLVAVGGERDRHSVGAVLPEVGLGLVFEGDARAVLFDDQLGSRLLAGDTAGADTDRQQDD